MRHFVYGDKSASASIAILIKETSFDVDKIERNYIDAMGANPNAFIGYSLWYDDKNKCPAAIAKDYLQTLLLSVKQQGIKILLVTDSKYFKYITGEQSAALGHLGYAIKSKIENYKDEFDVFYVPNYQAAKYNPKTGKDLQIGLDAFKTFLTGNYTVPGENIIHSAAYPDTMDTIQVALDWLLLKPELTVDIEGLSLDFWTCGIATISFAWTKHDFIAIPVERGSYPIDTDEFFEKVFATAVKEKLKAFFEAYTGKLIPHNAGFDFKVLTYELWMQNLQDYKGMLKGIEILTEDFDDTKIIAYLATNNAVENTLGLKPLSAEYMGVYAEDLTDTSIIPLPDLLLYNGKDSIATWFAHGKYMPKLIADNQLQIYEEEFKPSVITLLQTELCGMPIFPKKVAEAKKKLTDLQVGYMDYLDNSKLIQEFQLDVKTKACAQFTEEAKKKVFDMNDPRVTRLWFNPNSNQQVANLLYTYLGFPVLDTTDGGQPATGGDTLEKLLNHTKNQVYQEIIKTLLGLTQVDKILTSFIPAFEKAVQMPDGSWRLYGNFNLGGTKSGRLSSSNPNLQNLPSHSIWAKLIKSCFGCIDGWLFGGADFNSLEDMVSALLTRDTNKMKVYLDGYDGHSIRAYSYYPDKMPNLQKQINARREFEITIDGKKTSVKAGTMVLCPNGNSLPIEEYYDSL